MLRVAGDGAALLALNNGKGVAVCGCPIVVGVEAALRQPLLRMFRRRIGVLLAMLALAACHEGPENPPVYTAVVESVEATSPMILEEYSISRGRELATFITLRLVSVGSRKAEGRITIVALGLRSADAYGSPGDAVSFSAESLLNEIGLISANRLLNYRVVPGGGVGDTSSQRDGDHQTAEPRGH